MWVSKESPTKYCIGYRTWCVCALIASFPFTLYMEMKRSFMLFPLVALFIAVWRFISWFHLRFRRLFLGKPLKCVSDSKQSPSRFLSPLAFSLMIKKKQKKQSEIFKVKRDTLWSQSLSGTVLRKGNAVLVPLADMKGEQRIVSVISLISIISAVWMNFKWLAPSYLCYHRSNMSTFYALCCCAVNEVGRLSRGRTLCFRYSH